eukprot:3656377-Alexandrium_andersonii.AAC.1
MDCSRHALLTVLGGLSNANVAGDAWPWPGPPGPHPLSTSVRRGIRKDEGRVGTTPERPGNSLGIPGQFEA